MDEEQTVLDKWQTEHEQKVFFTKQNLGAEVHWFFTQGYQALKQHLYLPACLSFLNGIEASVRVTLKQIEEPVLIRELNPREVLSNKLLKSAYAAGLPIEELAFPKEQDFLKNIQSSRKSSNVEIVRIRHNLCHGNILEYINTELGEDTAFFTPECCAHLGLELHSISLLWAAKLSEFRKNLFNTE